MDPIQALGYLEVILRILAATLIGAILGLNREMHGKPAGLRTHALVTLGSAIITLTSLNIANGAVIADPNAQSRVIQGIITGVGFLGAGVIMRDASGTHVYGLTTAATIWVAASLGIVCGLGHWRFVFLSSTAMMLVLVIGGPLEKYLLLKLKKWVVPNDSNPDA